MNRYTVVWVKSAEDELVEAALEYASATADTTCGNPPRPLKVLAVRHLQIRGLVLDATTPWMSPLRELFDHPDPGDQRNESGHH